MFTKVEDEVQSLTTDWRNESDIVVLCARMTIRLDGLRARFRQGRGGFNAANIMAIEELFERLALLEELQQCLGALEVEPDREHSFKIVKKSLNLLRTIGATAAAEAAKAEVSLRYRVLQPEIQRTGWQPSPRMRHGLPSSSSASFTC